MSPSTISRQHNDSTSYFSLIAGALSTSTLIRIDFFCRATSLSSRGDKTRQGPHQLQMRELAEQLIITMHKNQLVR